MATYTSKQNGAVSLFIVIFSALLIITIATAFIRIMMQDQLQATSNDLSKSALDSAYAGVEDTKRAIVEYYKSDPAANKPDCSTVAQGANNRCDDLRDALVGSVDPEANGWTEDCDATSQAGVARIENGEVLVKTSDADDALNQAYTCIKVQMNPVDVIGSLTPATSRVFQLKSKDNQPVTKIKVQWFLQQNRTLALPDPVPYELPDVWPENTPSVMKLQLLQYKGAFRVPDFDSDPSDGDGSTRDPKHNATLFLLPASIGADLDSLPLSFDSDNRQNINSLAMQQVGCHATPTASRYACEVIINLPCAGAPCDGYPGSDNDRTAFLRIGQYYSTEDTDFRITMLNEAGEEVRFTDVQPAVDSTGRSNDIFRRIQSRIDIGVSSVPTPEAAVDVTRSLCKEFLVTNDRAYSGGTNTCPVLP